VNNDKIIIALVVVLIVILAAGVLFLNPGHAKVDSKVIVTSNTTLHDGENFTIRLTDLNKTPIANQRVNITIIDANGENNPQTVTTDANGDGNLQLNGLNPGEYTFNVTYGGNENYTGCNLTPKITIEKKVDEKTTQTTQSTQDNEKPADDLGLSQHKANDYEYVGTYADGEHYKVRGGGELVMHGDAYEYYDGRGNVVGGLNV